MQLQDIFVADTSQLAKKKMHKTDFFFFVFCELNFIR